MITFCISIVALILGYFIYGKFVSRLFAPDDRPTPAVRHSDGVDFIPMPSWKVFMIQFLNIAGTGPIFGAIMGIQFGPSAYLWIVLGCIFAGAVHDYLSGMISLRNDGVGLPEIIGLYLGGRTRKVMLVFTVFILVMVGAVFVYSPSVILGTLTQDLIPGAQSASMFWLAVIMIYYLTATLLPIDKIIGKIYPVFAFCLLFMALAFMYCLFVKWPSIPEVWDGLENPRPELGPIFPCLFITIACGAISGFHATQSPLMARCMKSERMGRPVFYGAMITEGLVALVWAAVGAFFFYDGGAQDVGLTASASAPEVVNSMSRYWLGTFGGILAILGVVAAPITTGDTALRSSRLIIADFLHLEQRTIKNRLKICIPLFIATSLFLWYNLTDAEGFNMIWSYFGWSNQSLAVFTLWAITVYLVRQGKNYWLTLVPALLMTTVSMTYIFISKFAFSLPAQVAYGIGGASLLAAIVWFTLWKRRQDAPVRR